MRDAGTGPAKRFNFRIEATRLHQLFLYIKINRKTQCNFTCKPYPFLDIFLRAPRGSFVRSVVKIP